MSDVPYDVEGKAIELPKVDDNRDDEHEPS